MTAPPIRVGVLTVSDAGSRGQRVDGSGDRIAEWVEARGSFLARRDLVPDETGEIVVRLCSWSDSGEVDLILTTGGTGLTPRDVTPEATRAVLDREAPGLAEALRAEALPRFPRAALSRGLAGMRGPTLIINLPGSPGGVADGLVVLDRIVDHAVAMVRGQDTRHD